DPRDSCCGRRRRPRHFHRRAASPRRAPAQPALRRAIEPGGSRLERDEFQCVHEPALAKALAHSSAAVVRRAGQQPTKGGCATNRKRARDRAKTYLLSCKRSLLCANYLAVMVLFRETKLPVPGSGTAVARPPWPISTACRRRGGARSARRRLRHDAAVKIVDQSHSLCYLYSSRGSIGERHDQSTSSFAAHRPR